MLRRRKAVGQAVGPWSLSGKHRKGPCGHACYLPPLPALPVVLNAPLPCLPACQGAVYAVNAERAGGQQQQPQAGGAAGGKDEADAGEYKMQHGTPRPRGVIEGVKK